MERLTPDQKRKVAARINSFPTSGFTTKLSGSITRYYKSALGRDFKLLAQITVFDVWDYLEDQEQPMWLSLCKERSIHKMPWCAYYSTQFVHGWLISSLAMIMTHSLHIYIHVGVSSDILRGFLSKSCWSSRCCDKRVHSVCTAVQQQPSKHWLQSQRWIGVCFDLISPWYCFSGQSATIGLDGPKWSWVDTDSSVQLEMMLRSTINRSISSLYP